MNDGEHVITNVAYAPQDDVGVWFYSEGGAVAFTDISAWELSSIWKDAQ